MEWPNLNIFIEAKVIHLPENDMENKNSFALEPIKFRTYDISHAASPKNTPATKWEVLLF